MSLVVVLFSASTEPDGQHSLWATAVVAGGSAVLGALAGGAVSYLANVRLITIQRRFRAAVRRKAKVYVPLKLQLQQLHEAIERDDHLRWGIARDESRPGFHHQAPVFDFWERLVEDGRVSFALSREVREAMQAFDRALDEFSAARQVAGERFEAVGRPLYGEVTGNDKFQTAFDGSAMPEAVRDPAEPWRYWQFGETPGFEEFRRRFNEAEEVEEARDLVLGAEVALSTALTDAVCALDDGITRISIREEKESPKD